MMMGVNSKKKNTLKQRIIQSALGVCMRIQPYSKLMMWTWEHS